MHISQSIMGTRQYMRQKRYRRPIEGKAQGTKNLKGKPVCCLSYGVRHRISAACVHPAIHRRKASTLFVQSWRSGPARVIEDESYREIQGKCSRRFWFKLVESLVGQR